MGLDEDVSALKETVQELILRLRHTPPVGTILLLAADAAPLDGYLVCDGAEYDVAKPENERLRSLLAVLRNTYGGDGVNTFRVPELRGEFLRVLDRGRGVDTGRALGQGQEAWTAMPRMPFLVSPSGDHRHSIVESGLHRHGSVYVGTKKGLHGNVTANATPCPDETAAIPEGGVHTHDMLLSGPHVHSIVGGDPETRPRNMALVGYIRW
jgi:microcystin-dependent protein